MPCSVIGNISLFESVRVACQRHRLQVQSLTGQLGGKQSPGSYLCAPPISCSCSPTGRGDRLRSDALEVQILSGVPNIRVWCSLVCTPVLGTGSRRFKSYHSDSSVVGRADMQPPFKRRDPGSTPGRPTKSNLGVWQNGYASDS
jgi:hypothetical protein